MCNFIMIMILLVTAYNGMWEQGRQEAGYTRLQQIPQTASRAHWLPAGVTCWAFWRSPADGLGVWQQLAARPAGGSRESS